MGNGGINAKRKNREKPKSPRERYEYETSSSSSTGTTGSRKRETVYEGDRYVRKGSNQKSIDTSLKTTKRKKWERERNGKHNKKGE